MWFHVPHTRSDLLRPAFSLGFKNHHCREEYFVLYLVLDPTFPLQSLPLYGTACIKVFAFLCRSDSFGYEPELFVVRERYTNRSSGRLWKFVSGSVNRGETIASAIEREIFEEVGLRVQYIDAIKWTLKPETRFQQDQLSFCCYVELLQQQQEPVLSNEIADWSWIPMRELKQLWTRESNSWSINKLEYQSLYAGFTLWKQRKHRSTTVAVATTDVQ